MEELCYSIGRQNATMLTGSLANSAPSSPPVTFPREQPDTEKPGDQGDTENTQNNDIDSDDSVGARTCVQDGKEEQDDEGDLFADGLNAYIPEGSALMQSVRIRSPHALFVNERYPSGCTIDDLGDGVLQDLCADSNIDGWRFDHTRHQSRLGRDPALRISQICTAGQGGMSSRKMLQTAGDGSAIVCHGASSENNSVRQETLQSMLVDR
jgi:hypothetical protein